MVPNCQQALPFQQSRMKLVSKSLYAHFCLLCANHCCPCFSADTATPFNQAPIKGNLNKKSEQTHSTLTLGCHVRPINAGHEKGTIILNPLVDYLEKGTVLNRLGVWFDCGLNIFICCLCQVALTSDIFNGYCKVQHAHTIAGKDSEDLKAFLHYHHVFAHPKNVPLSSLGGPVIQGLGPPQFGFTCQIASCTVLMLSSLRTSSRNMNKLNTPSVTFTRRDTALATSRHSSILSERLFSTYPMPC